jgi:hypothetical protein
MKLCTKCNLAKPTAEFSPRKTTVDGLNWICKECARSYYAANKEKINNRRRVAYPYTKKHNSERSLEYRRSNKQRKAEYDKKYRVDNREKIAAQKRNWERTQRETSTQYKLVSNLRRRLVHALKGHYKTGATLSLLGCSISEFKLHLESLFQEGMSWDNYGVYGWHIDHIIPCYAFDLSDPAQQLVCFHYTNLRPLWAKDNLSRSKSEVFCC